MTIRHVVVWTMAAEDADTRREHAAEVAARLRALVGVVPGIRGLTAGPECIAPGQNADVALVVDVEDPTSLDEYQRHPAHQEVGAYIRSVAASRIAVDFEL